MTTPQPIDWLPDAERTVALIERLSALRDKLGGEMADVDYGPGVLEEAICVMIKSLTARVSMVYVMHEDHA